MSTFCRAIVVSLLVAVPTLVSAQESGCPAVWVSCASKECNLSPLHFMANVSKTITVESISYEWALTKGLISSGQGTPFITVEYDNRRDITATVTVRTKNPKCEMLSSMSLIPGIPVPPVQQTAEFGSVPFDRVELHLMDLANQRRNQPGAMGFIVVSKKWKPWRKANAFLTKVASVEPRRIVLVERSQKGPLVVKLFIVPSGAVLPTH
jgi:hypothetical protein